MNAVNFIDGLDGLVAGVVFIGTAVFFAYSYLLAQQTSPTNYFNLASLLSAIVLGMCIGFLPYNWHRAKIFMGDSGAMLLGLLMATSALTVTGQIDPQIISRGELIPAFIPLILPLAILILPLLDFSLAVFRRLRAGKSPFAADREHIHHRLQDFGHSHLGSVLVFYVWTALISLTCLLFFFWPNWAVWLFLNFGLIAALTFTLWPLIQRRRNFQKSTSDKQNLGPMSKAANLLFPSSTRTWIGTYCRYCGNRRFGWVSGGGKRRAHQRPNWRSFDPGIRFTHRRKRMDRQQTTFGWILSEWCLVAGWSK